MDHFGKLVRPTTPLGIVFLIHKVHKITKETNYMELYGNTYGNTFIKIFYKIQDI